MRTCVACGRGRYRPEPVCYACDRRQTRLNARRRRDRARWARVVALPERLVEPCILASSRSGDLVLDPFAGSGTTGAVAVRHQRSFVGCELNPVYVELARKRISAVAPLLATEAAS